MVTFATDKPVRSKVPQVVVENPLKPGTYRFSLVVIDEFDNESAPFDLAVTVVEQTRTTVLRPELIREAVVLRQPIGINPRMRVIR